MPSPVEMSTFYYIWQSSNDLQDAAFWGLFLVSILLALAWRASNLIASQPWRTRARWFYLVQVATLITMIVSKAYVH